MTAASIDPGTFRKVLASYPTGVSVVTALDTDGGVLAMVVGSFTSVSLDPPLVGFLPDKRSSTWPLIQAAGHFCVNVLGSDQIDVCRAVVAKTPDRLAEVSYVLSEHNLPVIANAIAAIECSIHSVVEAGDHWIVLGRVLSLDIIRDEDPLLFHRGRYGGFAELA